MLQNLPSVVAALALRPAPGSRVLDMCAAPGGKTTLLAQLMGDKGSVIALDRTHSKVRQTSTPHPGHSSPCSPHRVMISAVANRVTCYIAGLPRTQSMHASGKQCRGMRVFAVMRPTCDVITWYSPEAVRMTSEDLPHSAEPCI
jgi:hypothetical protein